MEGKKALIEEQEELVSGAGHAKHKPHCSKCGSDDVLVKTKTLSNGKVIIGYHCRTCGYDYESAPI